MDHKLRTLSGLLAFDAAARHESLTLAAKELGRTQSAVSQQVKLFEEQVGLALFVRRPRKIVLTPAGRTLADAVRAALDGVNSTLDELKRRCEPNVIQLTVYHSFAINWLIPRLPNFGVRHPELDVRVNANDRPVDLVAGGFDIAIRGVRRGQTPPPGSLHVRTERVIPVYAPSLSPGGEITVRDLNHYPLIREEGRSLWREWFDRNNLPGPVVESGKSYSHTGLLVQAAAVGVGIALVPVAVAAESLKTGRLKCVAGVPMESGYRLYIVKVQDPPPEKIRQFIAWFTDEMAAMDAEMAPYLTPA